MNNTDERIARIHERAKEIKEEKSRRLMQTEGTVSAVLGVLLIVMIGIFSRAGGSVSQTAVQDAGYAGASMFGSAAGGYILIALIAFMLGAVTAILIRTYMEKSKHMTGNQVNGPEDI